MESNIKKSNKSLLLSGFTILFLVLIVGLFIFLCNNFSKKSETFYDIRIDKKSNGLSINKNNDKSFTIKYLINEGKSEEYFTIREEKLEYIFKNNTKNESPFFSCSARSFNKIIYIVLDVSGSVIDGYSINNAIEKIYTILGDNIQPGDQIRIRFIGNNSYNDKEYNIDFTGPKFNNYQLTKNERLNKDIITLKDYSEEKMPSCNSSITASTIKTLIEKITSIYKERIKNKDDYTNIINTLESISNEVKIESEKEGDIRFESVLYVLFTDGKQTDGGYEDCDTEPAISCGKNIKGLRMSDNDEAIVIGIESSSIKEIFNKLFDNIKINFK